MIVAIMPKDRHLYKQQLEEMYTVRYDVCIKKWGWDVPGSAPGCDKDQFDTESTIYLIALADDQSTVLGCCRLNPTTEPYMVPVLWPEACNLITPPSDPRYWESSRFVVRSGLGSKKNYMEIMWRLCAAVCEFCVANSFERIVWYTDPGFYQTMNSLMRIIPLGTPHYNEQDEKTYIAGMGLVTEEAVTKARANLIDPSMQLTYMLAPLTAKEAA